MLYDPKVRVEELETHRRRSHFNFGTITGNSIAYIFNFMRYNSAFLAREQDLKTLMEAAKNYGDWITHPFQIVVCRYSFAGVTQPGWETGPLPSGTDFEPHRDTTLLYELGVDRVEFRANPKLKFQHIATSEGKIGWQLRTMYENQAFPHREADANALERGIQWCFIEGEEKGPQPFEIELANFKASKTEWRWPQEAK